MRDWKESYVDQMALIVTLSGEERFKRLTAFKAQTQLLEKQDQAELSECIRLRFTPSNGQDGCQSATDSVNSVIK